MGKIIAVTGKGGTGKTTIAALIIRALLDKKAGLILGVDADPNSTLGDAIGLKVDDTISSICEEMLDKKEALPAGMTKDRFLEYKIQQSLIERDNLSLLTMGRPEGAGCYCFVNNLLREMIKNLTDDYDFTVADNEAGMEHLSRKTMRKIDVLFVVSDFSIIGVRSAAKIYNLARAMGIKLGENHLVINKSKDGIAPLEKEVYDSGIPLIGTIPFDAEIEKSSLGSYSILDLPGGSAALKAINEIVAKAVY